MQDLTPNSYNIYSQYLDSWYANFQHIRYGIDCNIGDVNYTQDMKSILDWQLEGDVGKLHDQIEFLNEQLCNCSGVTPSCVGPTVASSPYSVTIDPGNPVVLSGFAYGTTPFTYQWYKDGAPITGATIPNYVINSVSSG